MRNLAAKLPEYIWLEFKKRLAGDTARQATGSEVKALRAEARDLKEALAEQMLENRLLKSLQSP